MDLLFKPDIDELTSYFEQIKYLADTVKRIPPPITTSFFNHYQVIQNCLRGAWTFSSDQQDYIETIVQEVESSDYHLG